MSPLPPPPWWHSKPGSLTTTVIVQRCTSTGAPNMNAQPFEACAACFKESGEKEAPPIVQGYCPACGRRHQSVDKVGDPEEENKPKRQKKPDALGLAEKKKALGLTELSDEDFITTMLKRIREDQVETQGQ